ncbi:bifunctional oligoribonuclease/PAP phosphatase NrnA [Paenibacillus thermoaerophilus]|uniref:Bifunctional oligoribonuclease/PAP phosphatase NrnA n=1 Tax=Paenibacillus thermoaerophilus TaxID=1215385 RepID=A0ABW2V655_9BACL|nr:bifunctional oligoribonuclease/PAP phosphatase NrnA [Paenibacillus thermoaerophilus]TMV13837.1 bifunctional oligoribonuclease/PAP phosphatase NrnA [Paenibacillus thermoaerophilus]
MSGKTGFFFPQETLRELREAAEFLRRHDDILVVSHVNPDGDAIGSTLAAGWLLGRMGKSYVMANQDAVPSKFGFLPNADRIVRSAELAGRAPFRAAVFVDCADRARAGDAAGLLSPDAAILNIDHHATNDRFGTQALVMPDASATCEMLWHLIGVSGEEADASVGECIYTGILTDTGGFRYSNTSRNVMILAAELLGLGVQGHVLAERLLETMTYAQIELLKRGLQTLEFACGRRVAYVSVTLKDLQELRTDSSDLDGLVNYARNVAGVEVGLLFRQDAEDKVKVSFRSRGQVDVSRVAGAFGGGGHVRASGATVAGTLEEVRKAVLREVELALE